MSIGTSFLHTEIRMGRRKGTSFRHRLRRLFLCSSRASPSNRFLHEKDSLAFSPSFDEPSRISTYEKPSPPSVLTRSIRDPTTSTKVNVTLKNTNASSPSRSVHSAVTEVWSNAARRPSASAPVGVAGKQLSSTNSSVSTRPVSYQVGSDTSFHPSQQRSRVVNSQKSTDYLRSTKYPYANNTSVSDDEWNVLSSSYGSKSLNPNDTYRQPVRGPNRLATTTKTKLNPPITDSPARRRDSRKISTLKTPHANEINNNRIVVVVNNNNSNKMPTNLPSPDSVMVSNDGWGSFPSSNDMNFGLSSDSFFSFDSDFGAQQGDRNILAKNLFPSKGIENTPDPDFFFLDEEEESYFSEKSSQKNPTVETSHHQSTTLPATLKPVFPSTEHTTRVNNTNTTATTTTNTSHPISTFSSSPSKRETSEGGVLRNNHDNARSQRIGITPYSPKWAADNTSYPTKLSSITSGGLLVINHDQTPSDGDISSIGIQSAGSPSTKNAHSRAAAAAASARIMGSNSVDPSKAIGNKNNDNKNVRMHEKKEVEKNVSFVQPKGSSKKLPSSSVSSDEEILDDNSSSSVSDGNAFLFDTVENILGPRTMSADMESLGGFSNLSGCSKKSGKRYSRGSVTGGASVNEVTNVIKRNSSFHSIKSAPNYKGGENAHHRSDNVSVASRRSTTSKNSFKDGHDVTATLLQLEGKLAVPKQGSESYSQYPLSRTSSATSTSKRKARKIIVVAPPGRLGVILANRTNSPHETIVTEVREISPLAGKIGVGDRIIAVDDENVSEKTVAEITKLMAQKADAHRTLIFLTTRVAG